MSKELEAVQVIRVTFDTFENSIGSALEEKVIATFIGDSKHTAQENADKYIETLELETYKGWDRKPYPRAYTKKITIYDNHNMVRWNIRTGETETKE